MKWVLVLLFLSGCGYGLSGGEGQIVGIPASVGLDEGILCPTDEGSLLVGYYKDGKAPYRGTISIIRS
jgi:hypothetical protein